MRPIITLTNGKKVGNFSSPHPFTFEDGSILPAVSNELAEKLAVTFVEMKAEDEMRRTYGQNVTLGKPKEGDIILGFELSSLVRYEMEEWINAHSEGKVDVVFVPLPMMNVLRSMWSLKELIEMPFRTIRMTDRIEKFVSISKQCI